MYWNSAKDGTILKIDELVFKEWWTKYPGFDDCCGECPGYCAVKYESDIESFKDPWSGPFGWFICSIFFIVYNYFAMSLGQW
jgi:hypothetical protein